MALAVNLAALTLIFWGCLQLDRPLAQSARAIKVLWVEWVGDFFYLVGTGGGLVTISILLLAAGYVFKQPRLTWSGVESLVAHGVAAVIVQVLKRTIGRPRPRLMRDHEFFTGPSWGSGFESFPSGHAAASFAVAAVLSAHFPRWTWPVYSLAGLIVVSRVVRGSHYATDVTVGITVGLLVGSVVTRPYREWEPVVVRALAGLTPRLAIAFAFLWLVYHPVVDPVQDAMTRWFGVTAIAFGLGSRWRSTFRGVATAALPYARPAIGLGLALTTGAWLIVLIAVLIFVAQWPVSGDGHGDSPVEANARGLVVETTGAAALLIGVLLLQGLKGALAVPGL